MYLDLSSMAVSGNQWWLVASVALLGMFLATANGIDIFLEWNVAIDTTIKPAGVDQSVRILSTCFPYHFLAYVLILDKH